MTPKPTFGGAKILLHCDGELVTYLRDDKHDIPFPALWDLPGGGAEGDESPMQCVLRETQEEFGLSIPQDRIKWVRSYASQAVPNTLNWFFVAPIFQDEIDAIKFGDEGQYWQMMAIDTFLKHPKAIPHLQSRIRDFLAEEV